MSIIEIISSHPYLYGLWNGLWNDALIKNRQLQIIHKTMELKAAAKDKILDAKIDADKLEKRKSIMITVWKKYSLQ